MVNFGRRSRRGKGGGEQAARMGRDEGVEVSR